MWRRRPGLCGNLLHDEPVEVAGVTEVGIVPSRLRLVPL